MNKAYSTNPDFPAHYNEPPRLAADQAEQIDALKPKANALDLLSEHGSDMGVVDAGRGIKKE